MKIKYNVSNIHCTGCENRIKNSLKMIKGVKDVGIEAIKLPSPSPANCKRGIEEVLVNSYNKIKEYLD